jgi:hypothetical protein
MRQKDQAPERDASINRPVDLDKEDPKFKKLILGRLGSIGRKHKK